MCWVLTGLREAAFSPLPPTCGHWPPPTRTYPLLLEPERHLLLVLAQLLEDAALTLQPVFPLRLERFLHHQPVKPSPSAAHPTAESIQPFEMQALQYTLTISGECVRMPCAGWN